LLKLSVEVKVDEALEMMPLPKPMVVEVLLPQAAGVNGQAKRFAEVR